MFRYDLRIKGVVTVRKKSIAVTLVFTLVFSVLIGMAPAMAASGDITVTPLISDSADVHYFQVSNTSGEGLDIKWNTSLNTSVANTDYVPAGGSITLTCSDPAMGGLTLYVVYPGGQTSQMSASKYGVDVVYQDEEGNVLMSDTTTSSLGSGVSYSAQSYLELSSGEYDLISNSYQEYAYQSNIQTITFTYRKRVPQPYSCSVIFCRYQRGTDWNFFLYGRTGYKRSLYAGRHRSPEPITAPITW